MDTTIAPEAKSAPVKAARKPRAAKVVAPEGTRSYTVLTRVTAVRVVKVQAESESAARKMAADAGGFDAPTGETKRERTTVYAWRTPGK